MEDDHIIKGFIPELNDELLPETSTAISMIKARYGPGYSEEIENKFLKLRVYVLFIIYLVITTLWLLLKPEAERI